MTSKERDQLASLARKRGKVARSMIGERVKVLRAEVEEHLSATHRFNDELWVQVNAEALRSVQLANDHIAAITESLGIPSNLAPSLSVNWNSRGENALAERRIELRRLAHTRIDAEAESAKVGIEAGVLDVETVLVRQGLESGEAIGFLEAMPTLEQLMPSVDITALNRGDHHAREDERITRRGYGSGWQPPEGAAATLLTGMDASGRAGKREAIRLALAAAPDASAREIARRAGEQSPQDDGAA